MITLHDIPLILFLALMEGILSVDNALVLALLARKLPPDRRRKALTLGLGGAVVFRLAAIGLAVTLIRYQWVKLAGGAYLIAMAFKHFFLGEKEEHARMTGYAGRSFWRAVLMIELVDLAFAVDSILAAVALSSKFWIVFLGGFLGVIMVRIAATGFIRLLDRFPAFEASAYLLILLVGAKIILEGLELEGVDFHSKANPAFWVFWSAMCAAIAYGFRPRSGAKPKRAGHG